MAKIFICSKDGFLKNILEEIKKKFQSLEVHPFYDCPYSPCIAVADKDENLKVRFYGNPKFDALIETIRIFESGYFYLNKRVFDFIGMIDRKVHIKIFATQECGWCYPVIVKAAGFAYLSKEVYVDVFDCYSFPELAAKYNVITVPKTVINEKVEFIGSNEDNEFFGYIIKSIEEYDF